MCIKLVTYLAIERDPTMVNQGQLDLILFNFYNNIIELIRSLISTCVQKWRWDNTVSKNSKAVVHLSMLNVNCSRKSPKALRLQLKQAKPIPSGYQVVSKTLVAKLC